MTDSPEAMRAAIAEWGSLPMPVGDPEPEPARLSPQREAEIRERAEAANPLPWVLVPRDCKEHGAYFDLHGGPVSDDPADWWLNEIATHDCQIYGGGVPLDEANAEFLVHAREDVPALLAELAAVRAERDEARAELAKYVGHEPTAAEEMAFLNRCLDDVHAVCDEAEEGSLRWENPLPVPEWVAVVREAADGVRPEGKQWPADVIQYGIRIPDGSVLKDGTLTDLAEQQARLSRCRDTWPEAVLVQRTVRHGEWAEVTS
ncbi:hypothetical protein [Streptomyces formicae]